MVLCTWCNKSKNMILAENLRCTVQKVPFHTTWHSYFNINVNSKNYWCLQIQVFMLQIPIIFLTNVCTKNWAKLSWKKQWPVSTKWKNTQFCKFTHIREKCLLSSSSSRKESSLNVFLLSIWILKLKILQKKENIFLFFNNYFIMYN